MTHQNPCVSTNFSRAFALGVLVNAAYVAVEALCGLLFGSLALLADAGHNLSDVLGLLLSWGGHYLSGVKPTRQRTYGLRSSSILAALMNAVLLMVAVGAIVREAVRRFRDLHEVPGATIIGVAAIGVVINMLTALLFYRGRHGDLNIKAAFLHMAADAAVSLGVVAAGVAITLTGLPWIDPAISLIVAGVILVGTWSLLRDSLNLALHAVPKGIHADQVEHYLRQTPGVEALHDLHIWGMSTTETALTAHLVKPSVENEDHLLARLAHELHERFGITHVTLQIERSQDSPTCRLADDSLV